MIIFRYLWSVWCGIYFFLNSTFFVIGYRLILGKKPSDKQLSTALWWSKQWAIWLYSGFGVFIKTKYKERVKPYKNAVYVSNHQSFFDIPTCAIANPNKFRFLSKSEIRSFPFVGYVLKRIYYTVDRSSQESRKQSMRTMEQGIKTGFPVHLYIEGTRNLPEYNKDFLEFQKGAALIALNTGVPIVPLYIANSGEFLGKKFDGMRVGFIRTYWGNPVFVDENSTVESINQDILKELQLLKAEDDAR